VLRRLALAVALAAAAVSTLPAQAPGPDGSAGVRNVRRDVYRDLVRISIELDRAVPVQHTRLDDPTRVVVDLAGATGGRYSNGVLRYDNDVVRAVRVSLHDGPRTSIVLDLEDAGAYSVYAATNPHRVVIDVTRVPDTSVRVVPRPSPFPTPGTRPSASAPATPTPRPAVVVATPPPPAPAPAPEAADAAASPARDSDGGLSMSRQLGLGIARIVVDAGHGGRDPGSVGRGIVEKELVLDVALRLERLLEAEPGIEVVLTRSADVFVPLEERTAIANRGEADLFLSIHANASRNTGARGVETFFLNFARDPEAEALAARENAGSAQTMRSLPDIIQAITLNNKLDESRDFATIVHQRVHASLSAIDHAIEDRGVKQAPFVVLIGATMPSVLAEVSFLTNEREAELLRTDEHRQRIAEALRDGVLDYAASLHLDVVATR
jgi:N-acetylmuramoyl-L-alanine amidase